MHLFSREEMVLVSLVWCIFIAAIS